MAALVSPGGLHDAMYHSDAGKSVPPREGLADVFRVAQEYQRVSGSRRLKSAVEDIALRRDPIDEAQATKDLYRLADDFGKEPHHRHQRTVAVLLRERAGWFGTEEARKDFVVRFDKGWVQTADLMGRFAVILFGSGTVALTGLRHIFNSAQERALAGNLPFPIQGALLLAGLTAAMFAIAGVQKHRALQIEKERAVQDWSDIF